MTDHHHPPVGLRLEPHAIPALRAAFQDALDELRPLIVRLRQVGHLQEAWLGDETSESVKNHYNAAVMQAPDGPYAAPRAYERELTTVRDTLQRLEDDYRRREGENAALWGRRA